MRSQSTLDHRIFVRTAKGEDLFGEQLLGSSDWADFEGNSAFTVPPKAMPELYANQAEVWWRIRWSVSGMFH